VSALILKAQRLLASINLSGVPFTLSMLFNAEQGLHITTQLCHELARHSGWWDGVDPKDKYIFATKIALIHSEVSEAMEGGRKGEADHHLTHRKAEEVELADALIRIFDLAGARNLDLAGALMEKLAYNQKRADHTPEARAAEGGKSF